MKRLMILVCFVPVFTARFATAQIMIAATPSTQTVSSASKFNVSFSLSVAQNTAPADALSFDLYLATAAANSGFFTITTATSTGVFNTSGPTIGNGDPLSTAAAAGFVRNGMDLSFTANTAQPTPLTNIPLEMLTISIAPNTPAKTYTFQTSTSANSGGSFSDVIDSGGVTYPTTSAGSFSITVVPEPGTGTLLALGAVGVLAAGILRCRRMA